MTESICNNFTSDAFTIPTNESLVNAIPYFYSYYSLMGLQEKVKDERQIKDAIDNARALFQQKALNLDVASLLGFYGKVLRPSFPLSRVVQYIGSGAWSTLDHPIDAHDSSLNVSSTLFVNIIDDNLIPPLSNPKSVIDTRIIQGVSTVVIRINPQIIPYFSLVELFSKRIILGPNIKNVYIDTVSELNNLYSQSFPANSSLLAQNNIKPIFDQIRQFQIGFFDYSDIAISIAQMLSTTYNLETLSLNLHEYRLYGTERIITAEIFSSLRKSVNTISDISTKSIVLQALQVWDKLLIDSFKKQEPNINVTQVDNDNQNTLVLYLQNSDRSQIRQIINKLFGLYDEKLGTYANDMLFDDQINNLHNLYINATQAPIMNSYNILLILLSINTTNLRIMNLGANSSLIVPDIITEANQMNKDTKYTMASYSEPAVNRIGQFISKQPLQYIQLSYLPTMDGYDKIMSDLFGDLPITLIRFDALNTRLESFKIKALSSLTNRLQEMAQGTKITDWQLIDKVAIIKNVVINSNSIVPFSVILPGSLMVLNMLDTFDELRSTRQDVKQNTLTKRALRTGWICQLRSIRGYVLGHFAAASHNGNVLDIAINEEKSASKPLYIVQNRYNYELYKKGYNNYRTNAELFKSLTNKNYIVMSINWQKFFQVQKPISSKRPLDSNQMIESLPLSLRQMFK